MGEGIAAYVQAQVCAPVLRAALPSRALSSISEANGGNASLCAASASRGTYQNTQSLMQTLKVPVQWAWVELQEPVFWKAPPKILIRGR